jgi:hypothetical protein
VIPQGEPSVLRSDVDDIVAAPLNTIGSGGTVVVAAVVVGSAVVVVAAVVSATVVSRNGGFGCSRLHHGRRFLDRAVDCSAADVVVAPVVSVSSPTWAH